MKPLPLFVLILFVAASPRLRSQDLQNFLSLYSEEPAEPYVLPLLESFSTSLHTAAFSAAAGSKEDGFHFGVSVTAIAGFVSDENRIFEAFSDIEGRDIEVPTIWEINSRLPSQMTLAWSRAILAGTMHPRCRCLCPRST